MLVEIVGSAIVATTVMATRLGLKESLEPADHLSLQVVVEMAVMVARIVIRVLLRVVVQGGDLEVMDTTLAVVSMMDMMAAEVEQVTAVVVVAGLGSAGDSVVLLAVAGPLMLIMSLHL